MFLAVPYPINQIPKLVAHFDHVKAPIPYHLSDIFTATANMGNLGSPRKQNLGDCELQYNERAPHPERVFISRSGVEKDKGSLKGTELGKWAAGVA